ncbi:4Fe-4S dicluster domain-containing protein, partial [bacterium]|nr:4Fe-4S dicluster domain-containing protein [bacterium]
MYLIKKTDVLNLAEELSKEYSVYGPMIENETGQTFFDQVDYISELDLSAPLPSAPPKYLFFPQMERIMAFKCNGEKKEVAIQTDFKDKAKALFGLRPCDLAGLQCLDRIFLGQEFVDEFYRYHRKKTFIVTNTCVVPYKQCFCVCTDSGPCAYEGFDLNLTDIGDFYLIETGSDNGKELAGRLALKKADQKHLDEKNRKVEKSISLFEEIATDAKAWVSRVMNRVTTGFIDDKVWEYIGGQCFECGACSYVCPTCSCFNVVDVNAGNGTSERLRTWDSCSYEGYSRMAGGHNPRKPVEDRRNKRFFCKLSYSQSKKYLRPGCVGCGRCVWVCPGDIGMPNVVTYIRREIQ